MNGRDSPPTETIPIEALPAFKWKFGMLAHESKIEMARLIDRLESGPTPSGGERVGGTSRLYRLSHGGWRLLYVYTGARVVLVALELGRRPAAFRRRRASPGSE